MSDIYWVPGATGDGSGTTRVNGITTLAAAWTAHLTQRETDPDAILYVCPPEGVTADTSDLSTASSYGGSNNLTGPCPDGFHIEGLDNAWVCGGVFYDTWTDEGGGVYSRAAAAEPVEIFYQLTRDDVSGTTTGVNLNNGGQRQTDLDAKININTRFGSTITKEELCAWSGLLLDAGATSTPSAGEWGYTGGRYYVNPTGGAIDTDDIMVVEDDSGFGFRINPFTDNTGIVRHLRTQFFCKRAGNEGYGIQIQSGVNSLVEDCLVVGWGWHAIGAAVAAGDGHVFRRNYASGCDSRGSEPLLNPFVSYSPIVSIENALWEDNVTIGWVFGGLNGAMVYNDPLTSFRPYLTHTDGQDGRAVNRIIIRRAFSIDFADEQETKLGVAAGSVTSVVTCGTPGPVGDRYDPDTYPMQVYDSIFWGRSAVPSKQRIAHVRCRFNRFTTTQFDVNILNFNEGLAAHICGLFGCLVFTGEEMTGTNSYFNRVESDDILVLVGNTFVCDNDAGLYPSLIQCGMPGVDPGGVDRQITLFGNVVISGSGMANTVANGFRLIRPTSSFAAVPGVRDRAPWTVRSDGKNFIWAGTGAVIQFTTSATTTFNACPVANWTANVIEEGAYLTDETLFTRADGIPTGAGYTALLADAFSPASAGLPAGARMPSDFTNYRLLPGAYQDGDGPVLSATIEPSALETTIAANGRFSLANALGWTFTDTSSNISAVNTLAPDISYDGNNVSFAITPKVAPGLTIDAAYDSGAGASRVEGYLLSSISAFEASNLAEFASPTGFELFRVGARTGSGAAWANATNVTTEDLNAATVVEGVSPASSSSYLVARNFVGKDSIPADAIITGIEVQVRIEQTITPNTPIALKAYLMDNTTDRGEIGIVNLATTFIAQTITFGSSSSVPVNTFTDLTAAIKGTLFGIGFRNSTVAGPAYDIQVYWIKMNVHWVLPGGGAGVGLMMLGIE